MSVSNRKIGLYTFSFINTETNEILSKDDLKKYFNDLLKTINATKFEDKKITVTSSNKFYYLVDFKNDEIINIIFESAKVGHRPKLVDEKTGAKRDNPKTLHEGEAEITHLSIKYDIDKLFMAIEERKVGVTIGQIAIYLNGFIHKFPPEKQFFVEYNIIPYDGFIEQLPKFNRITVGHIIIDKQDIGTEYLDQAKFGSTVRNPIEITFKANNREALAKGLIKSWWYALIGKKEVIKRIKIEGVSHEGAKIRLDTESLKMVRNINVNILSDIGIVDSEDMFERLKTILQDT